MVNFEELFCSVLLNSMLCFWPTTLNMQWCNVLVWVLALLDINHFYSFFLVLLFCIFRLNLYNWWYLLILMSWFVVLDQPIREGQRCYCSGTSNCSPWGITSDIIFCCKCPEQFSYRLQGLIRSVVYSVSIIALKFLTKTSGVFVLI
jgi:hypothetical protein